MQNVLNIEYATIVVLLLAPSSPWSPRFPNGSQVLFPNGEVDPWHPLSVLVPGRYLRDGWRTAGVEPPLTNDWATGMVSGDQQWLDASTVLVGFGCGP